MTSGYNPYATGGAPPVLHQPQPYTPPSGGQIVPGTITYTTSTGVDGRVIYHPFKAVSASYQTPSGVVAGIQWVPAEATQILPAGAQPANADFAASWNRGYLSNRDQKALKECRQKEEDKRRRKEEKEAKRLREKDHELRKAREREHERSKSFNAGNIPPTDPGYPNMAGGYGSPNSGYGATDLDRRFADMGVDSRRDERHARTTGGVYGPSVYSSNVTGYPTATRGSTYPGAGSPYRPASRGASPNMRPTDVSGYQAPLRSEPIARSTSPFGVANPTVYPRGHVMEGQVIGPRSRASTPVPGSAAGTGVTGFPQATVPLSGGSPHSMPTHMPIEHQLSAPEAFSRPLNAAQPYTPFETLKVQDMDNLLDNVPRMPLVLQPHDVYHEDWIRFMQDLARAWSGNLPVPDLAGGRAPKRSTLTADLIDVWNRSFFVARGVEVGLYKGREKRSGADAGTIDHRLPLFDPDQISSSSSSSTSDSDSESSGDDRYGHGGYGRQAPGYSDSMEARHKRQEKKAEKKRRAKEKKSRRKAKEREKRYSLYLICVPLGGVGASSGYSTMGGRSSPMPMGMGGRASPLPGAIGGRTSPMPGGYGVGGRTSPMPGGYGAIGGRTSPMPGGGFNATGGRTSPMPGGYNAMGGRTSPMPGGGYNTMGGRTSPMPGGYGGKGY